MYYEAGAIARDMCARYRAARGTTSSRTRVKNVGTGELETWGKGRGREWAYRVETWINCGEGRTWRVVPQEKPLELHGAYGGVRWG